MIVLTYVDDCIIFGQSMEKIDTFVQSMEVGPRNFTLTDEGDMDKFLRIKINRLDEKIFKISQTFLIDIIISFLNIDTNEFGLGTNPKSTPVGKPLLNKDLSGKPCKIKLELPNSSRNVNIFSRQQSPINFHGRP